MARELTTKGELGLADQRQAIKDTLSYWEIAAAQYAVEHGEPNDLAENMIRRWTAIRAEFNAKHGD